MTKWKSQLLVATTATLSSSVRLERSRRFTGWVAYACTRSSSPPPHHHHPRHQWEDGNGRKGCAWLGGGGWALHARSRRVVGAGRGQGGAPEGGTCGGGGVRTGGQCDEGAIKVAGRQVTQCTRAPRHVDGKATDACLREEIPFQSLPSLFIYLRAGIRRLKIAISQVCSEKETFGWKERFLCRTWGHFGLVQRVPSPVRRSFIPQKQLSSRMQLFCISRWPSRHSNSFTCWSLFVKHGDKTTLF